MTIFGLLSRFAGFFGQSIERAQQQSSDAYLAGAVDHVDLELRMRELDRAPVWIPSYG
jgi:hypothetical protein